MIRSRVLARMRHDKHSKWVFGKIIRTKRALGLGKVFLGLGLQNGIFGHIFRESNVVAHDVLVVLLKNNV